MNLDKDKYHEVKAAIGAAIAMCLTNPLNLVRFRLQTMPDLVIQKRIQIPYKGVRDCIRRIYKQEGKLAFWKGNFSNLLRFYPAESLTFFLKNYFNIFISTIFQVQQNKSVRINLASGILAGVSTLIMLYPLQYIRLRLSNDVKSMEGGIFKCLSNTIKSDGLRGLFRGSLISFIGMACFRGTFFGLYDTLKIYGNHLHQHFLLSYISTVIALVVIYPFDTIRRRMMMTSGQNYKYQSYSKFIWQIYHIQGFKGFFRGTPIIFFEGMTIGIMFTLFDSIFCKIKIEQKFQEIC